MDNITVLCALKDSVYKKIHGLDVWDKERNAYNYCGSNKIIAHPPCQQWSRMKAFAKEDKLEKDLAMFCLELIHKNGGVLEHPAGSSFFKHAGIKPTLSINQKWFGFPAEKRTYLYFYNCVPVQFPLILDLPSSSVAQMHSSSRSITTLPFAKFLIESVNNKI